MTPSDHERLARIQEVAEHGMRYYTTAFLKRGETPGQSITDKDLLRACFMQLANILTLLEQEEIDDRSMLMGRDKIVDRYLELAKTDPWTPPPSR